MNTAILLSLLLSSPTGDVPDLCAEPWLGPDGAPVHDSTGRYLAQHCEWSGPEVPVWDGLACCELGGTSSSCTAANARDGSCSSGEPYYCEFGELDASGELACYQPWPSACDAGLCLEAPSEGPIIAAVTPLVLCCDSNGTCVWVGYNSGNCQGEILHCFWGMTMEDGTVECFE